MPGPGPYLGTAEYAANLSPDSCVTSMYSPMSKVPSRTRPVDERPCRSREVGMLGGDPVTSGVEDQRLNSKDSS